MPFIQNSDQVSRRWWLVIPLGILALILAHWMALLFRYQPGVSLWFPPSGVAIALTFWFGSIGAMMTGIASIIMAPLWGHDGWSRLIGLMDIIEPLTAWFLYQRCFRGSLLLNRLKDTAAFILSAPLAGCFMSALVGNLFLLISGKISSADIVSSISQWWLGNALGTIAIAPVALLLITPLLKKIGCLKPSSIVDIPIGQFSKIDRKIWLELVAIAFFSISTAAITVSETHNGGFAFQQLSFLSFVPMIWAAIRFGVSGAMITASFCVFSTLCAYLIKYPEAISLNPFPVSIEVLYVHKLNLLIQCGVTLLMGTAITEKTAFQVALAVEQVRLKEHYVRGQLTEKLTELNISLGTTNTRLEETLAMLDVLLDSAPMGISFRDRNLRCIRTNNSMAEMMGVSPQESLGKKVSEVSPLLGQILEPLMQSILDTGKPVLNFEINNEAIAPIGKVRYWLCNYYPVHIDGEIIGIGGSVVEITELKHIETALRSSESRLRQIINSGMVGITFGDFSGNVLECNQAFLNMLD
ncbi:MAG: MASE1 domain-containing protein, partial [Crinalium sp.]